MRAYHPGDDCGRIVFDPDEIMRKRGLTDAGLCRRAQIRPEQLRRYRQNKIKFVTLDVAERLCFALECQFTDIFHYLPPAEGSAAGEGSAAAGEQGAPGK